MAAIFTLQPKKADAADGDLLTQAEYDYITNVWGYQFGTQVTVNTAYTGVQFSFVLNDGTSIGQGQVSGAWGITVKNDKVNKQYINIKTPSQVNLVVETTSSAYIIPATQQTGHPVLNADSKTNVPTIITYPSFNDTSNPLRKDENGRVFYYAWNWQSEGQYNLPETIRYYLFEDGIKAFVANQGQRPTDSDGAALPEKIAQIPTVEEEEGKDSFEYDGTQKEPALLTTI